MQQALVYTTIIDKAGGLFHFQIRLPQDTKKIIGIETGLSIRNAFPDFAKPVLPERFRPERNILMGRLKLQSLNSADFFYTKDIFDNDYNEGKAEIAYIPVLLNPKQGEWGFNPPIENGFDAYRWIHAGRKEEEKMDLCSSGVIKGIYNDAVGKDYSLLPDYTIKIYCWLET